MNGAQALLETLAGAGVELCIANPGTSEMHFVAGLDAIPAMRAVLGLFEGVVAGAADGYGRMTGKPAVTLLHLGPGLGNALANLHNARRAHTPIVNIVGDHATYHQQYDAPLQSDIDAAARTVSVALHRPLRPEDAARAAAAAVRDALQPPGGVASLVLPADVAWSPGAAPAPPLPIPAPVPVADDVIDGAAKVLGGGEQCALLLGGRALREVGLSAASRISHATGAKLYCETFPARLRRGAGLPAIERLGYFAEFVTGQLAGVRHLVLVDAAAPVSFFAYPGKPSDLVPPGCEVHVLAAGGDDAPGALAALADLVASREAPQPQLPVRTERPTGPLTPEAVANALGALLPEDAVVSDEGNTSGLWASLATAGAPPHDWLTLTGGAIGQGLPLATGAALACPGRKVVALEADGSAMYTLSALWTQARERLDITTIVFNNRAYAILQIELGRTGAGPASARAKRMLELNDPDLDFVAMAQGMGVEAVQATSAEAFTGALERALAAPGPHLIDAVLAAPA